jgi:hypothetical protein
VIDRLLVGDSLASTVAKRALRDRRLAPTAPLPLARCETGSRCGTESRSVGNWVRGEWTGARIVPDRVDDVPCVAEWTLHGESQGSGPGATPRLGMRSLARA